MSNDILTFVMAGGRGTRLEPLTSHEAKPAISFGGVYKIIDFTLSNCVNSGLNKIYVLTQFKSMSLERHVNCTWRSLINRHKGEFIETLPPQQRMNEEWYRGNADAVYQNTFAIEKERPKHIVILAGDHVYKMDYRNMLAHHLAMNAAVTVGGLPVPVDQAAGQFGVMQIDQNSRIEKFAEKPCSPQPLPNRKSMCLASMGIYIFETGYLLDQLRQSAAKENTQHDFGSDIIPSSIHQGGAYAFEFCPRANPGGCYWRDVGTLDAYYDANMDLLSEHPTGLQLNDPNWPIWRAPSQFPPATVSSSAHQSVAKHNRCNLISDGCIVYGDVKHSVLGPGCVIEEGARIENCILFDGVRIESDAILRNSIVMPKVIIPGNARVGLSNHSLGSFDGSPRQGFITTPQGRHVIANADNLPTKNRQWHSIETNRNALKSSPAQVSVLVK